MTNMGNNSKPRYEPRTFGVEKASPSVEELLAHSIVGHVAQEQDAISKYRELAGNSHDLVTRIVLEEILTDEQEQQNLGTRLRDVVFKATGQAAGKVQFEFELPEGIDPSDVALNLEKLAADEDRGAEELESQSEKYTEISQGFFSILMQSMAIDSRKHATMLRFLHKRWARIA